MGAEPYDYTVPFDPNVQSALTKLRATVFQSGAFNGAEFGPATPEEALEMADADGTCSILDIERIAEHPDFGCAAPLSPQELNRYFGTEKPSREQVEGSMEFWEEIERGQCRYVVLHTGDEPTEIYFAGYSFD